MNLFYSTDEVYLIICDNLNAMTSQQGSENMIIDQIKKFCIANIFSKEYTFALVVLDLMVNRFDMS
jgi:hypothetical protein